MQYKGFNLECMPNIFISNPYVVYEVLTFNNLDREVFQFKTKEEAELFIDKLVHERDYQHKVMDILND